MALTPRATAGRFQLVLDGVDCGFLRSVEGGGVKGEVVTESPGAEHYLKKHLGSAAQEPIELTFGLSLASGVYDWMAESWNGKQSPRSGKIVFADASLQAKAEVAFERALVASVTFPKQDGSSKDPCHLTLVIQPETAVYRKASGQLKAGVGAKAKQWLASNFRVDIVGLDCKKVMKVDAFTVTTRAAADEVGPRREPEEPKIDFPPLRITLPDVAAATWRAWHEDFVLKGNNGDAQEKTGALVLLGPSLKAELGRVELAGLGIYRLAPEKLEANKDAVARVAAELYCERMELAL